MTNAIDAWFARLRAEGRKAFLPFVAAGDPDLETTREVIGRLAACGAGPIEIGFPYSDPIADGPVIQSAFTRALEHGLKVDDIFACLKDYGGPSPLAAMVSYSIVYRRQPGHFLDQAKSAGISGLIVPDLPVEEADDLARQAADRDLKLVLLVTPTTAPERAARIARTSTGFLYCVSVTGLTGERDRLPPELHEQLRHLRAQTALPLCVGFGISKPEHVALLRDVADGIIVGSALVRRLEQIGPRPRAAVLDEITALVESLMAALNPPPAGGA
jgi:tryptophan synthase alpha chain